MIPFEREPRRPAQPDGTTVRGATADSDRAREADAATRTADRIAGWLAGPLLGCAAVAGALLVVRGPDRLFGAAFGLLLALGLGWIVVSALYPARADRRCPRCGREALERADLGSLAGVRCRACAWHDADASSFLLAEDDGDAFEDAVLRERSTRRRFRRW